MEAVSNLGFGAKQKKIHINESYVLRFIKRSVFYQNYDCIYCWSQDEKTTNGAIKLLEMLSERSRTDCGCPGESADDNTCFSK